MDYDKKDTFCVFKGVILLSLLIFIFVIISFNSIAQQFVEYKIKEGDCLWTISRKFQLSIQDVAEINGIDEEEILSPGLLIKIPQNQTNTSTNELSTATIVHTVQKGESLWDIAQKYRLSLDCISSANNLGKPDLLYIGQEINIPIEKSENKPEGTPELSFKTDKSNYKGVSSSLNREFKELVKETDYSVKAGESLWTIAQNYQVSLKELSEINDLEDAKKLSVGQIIKIPLRNWSKDVRENEERAEEEKTQYEGVEHIVESGESISVIAQRYHVPVETICQLNKISVEDYVFPGQRIKIKSSEKIPDEPSATEEVKPKDENSQTVYYIVKSGDSLWNIAKNYDVSMEGIIAVNYLSNKDVLSVGQKLEIPAMGGLAQGNKTVQKVEYTVVKGDSLWNIAQKFDVKMHEIINLNELQNITQLSVGQKLNIPASEKALALKQETKTTVTLTQDEKPKDIVHYVQKGETLWGISRKYQVSLQSVTNVNSLSENSRLIVGQKLVIPNGRDSSVSSRSFLWPINGLITSQFGMRTIGGRRDYHTGIDINGNTGDSIRAVESGKVTFSGYINGYGKTIIIEHSGGYSSVYAHNSSNLVSEGQNVKKGEVIARLGATGNATGSHLHFEIRENGKPINPLTYLP